MTACDGHRGNDALMDIIGCEGGESLCEASTEHSRKPPPIGCEYNQLCQESILQKHKGAGQDLHFTAPAFKVSGFTAHCEAPGANYSEIMLFSLTTYSSLHR